MVKLFIILVGIYYLVSFVLAIGSLIELVILKVSNEEHPVLEEDNIKTSIIVFVSGIWLPLMIHNTFKRPRGKE